MKPKAYIIIDGKPKEFADVQEAMAYAKEHGITDIEVVNLDAAPLKREIPDASTHAITLSASAKINKIKDTTLIAFIATSKK